MHLLPELTDKSEIQQHDKPECCLSVCCLSCHTRTPAALEMRQKEGTAAVSADLQHARLQRSHQVLCLPLELPCTSACSMQDEPAYCGLTSLAQVLNALAVDPRRGWKGPWR